VAAQRFRQAVDRVVQRIAATAEQGAPFRQQFRWLRLQRFPYLFYYEIRDPQPVLIYAVAHARRRPGYWLRRTRP
jgi:plasmid stabilization system protein ParE